jgi:hypothetical protein
MLDDVFALGAFADSVRTLGADIALLVTFKNLSAAGAAEYNRFIHYFTSS